MTDIETVENPTWKEVENAIQALDAEHLTLVMLAPAAPIGPPEGERHMGIGGGKDGRCVVYMTDDNLHFWNLEDASMHAATKHIQMVVGGQEGDYREARCAPRPWALQAARVYFQHGICAGDLTWAKD